MCAAAPLIAAGADDQIRHIFVTKTEPLSSSAMRLDEKSQAIKDQFLADTVKIRRALAGKQAALQAVYSARSGNTAAASRLGEEIFDLREQLRLKIQTTGLTPALLLDLSIPTCPEENQP
jgi:hypothetical protein